MRRNLAIFAVGVVLLSLVLSLVGHELGLGFPLTFGAQVSLQIAKLTVPPKVVAGEVFTANVSVNWSGFDENARTIVDNRGTTISVQPPIFYAIVISIEETTLDESVNGSGSNTFCLQVSAPSSAGLWTVTARLGLQIRMEASKNTINLMYQDSKELTIDVAPATTVTPLGITELSQDDGTAETSLGYGPGGEGGLMGVRFTGPTTPFQLLKVRYYLKDEASTPFAVLIWDEKQSPVFEREVTAKRTGWFDFDLSKSNLFFSGNEFYVLMKALNRGMKRTSPYLGWDTSKPDGKSFARTSDGTWWDSVKLAKDNGVEEGNFMIRIWVEAAKGSVSLDVKVPRVVALTVDGAVQPAGSQHLNLIIGTHTISVPDVVMVNASTRLKFQYWSDRKTETDRTMFLSHDAALIVIYVVQHLLIITSPQVNATGAGWYNEGYYASFSVPSGTLPMTGLLATLGGKLKFAGWYENGELVASLSQGTVIMNQPHALTAHWDVDFAGPLMILGVVITLSIVAVYLIAHKRRGLHLRVTSDDKHRSQ
jgi:hypothetical protein